MSLKFEVQPEAGSQVRLAILDGDDVLWPFPRSAGDGCAIFEAEDVLAYLADAWASLLLRQEWPNIFGPGQEPRSITGLLRAAEDMWEQSSAADVNKIDREQSEIEGFLYRHDFASMKLGAGLPEMYILRQGSKYRIETSGRVFDWPELADVFVGLEKLGAVARDLLAVQEGVDANERTISRWDRRNTCTPTAVAALITGVGADELDREEVALSPLLATLAGRGISEIANDNRAPMLAVARSSGSLGPSGIAELIRAFGRLPAGSSELLRRRRVAVKAEVRQVRGATDEGIRAAASVREWIRQPAATPVNLLRLCESLGIAVCYEDLDSRVHGLASNGPENGPAILLNRNTFRRGATGDDLERAMRFTMAHELGHLLLDESEWPAITDAVQQRVPRVIETRANAFAAHLLVPMDEAYRAFEVHQPSMTWSSIESALNLVGELFQVSRIVVSRQVFRGAPPERKDALKRLFGEHIPNFEGR